jgi:hypothetical protein
VLPRFTGLPFQETKLLFLKGFANSPRERQLRNFVNEIRGVATRSRRVCQIDWVFG